MKKILEKIYQEQWTRASYDSFSTNSFKEIDILVEDMDSEQQKEIIQFCIEQLEKNKQSINALYIAGNLLFQQNSINDEYVFRLIDLFFENNKLNVVEYLCKKLLQTKNNLKALRKLEEVYRANEMSKELVEVWEKIVLEDFEEADILYKLALYKIAHDEPENGILDLRKSINRYLYQRNSTQIREIWKILLEKDIANVNLFLSYISKVETSVGIDLAEELYVSLLNAIPKDSGTDIKIDILKNLLKIKSENTQYREQLVQQYQKKYEKHEKIGDFIRMTNLTQTWRNVHEAISDFEKHVSFFPNNFVYHNKWGIGKIKETTHLSLVIDFSKKRNHMMDIAMAVVSLEVLPKNHFWIIRSALTHENLRKKVIESPEWTLKCILKSHGSSDMKEIKSELVPDILSNQEWTNWSIKARKILNSNHKFAIVSNKIDHYTYSEVSVSPIEKLYKLLQIEEKFIGKIKFFRKAFRTLKTEAETNSLDYFWLMFDYFYSYIQNQNNALDENYVYALFVCEEALKYIPKHAREIDLPMQKILQDFELADFRNILKKLKISDYRLLLFHKIRQYKENWKELYELLFPYYPNEDIINELEQANDFELLEKIFLYVYTNPTKFREAMIWFTISLKKREWLEKITNNTRIFSNLIRISIGIVRDIANKQNVPKNKRNLTVIQDFLFLPENLPAATDSSNKQELQYIYSLLSQLNDIIPNKVLRIREQILVRFPNFEFNDQFNIEETNTSGFLTTDRLFREKQKELSHIYDTDIPANSKEIEKARAFGDLKENAEYKAALEQQEGLNSRVGQLKQEIEQARIFNFENVNTAAVSFGTKVTLEEHTEDGHNKKSEFTILGPWESNPEEGVISYLSPFGQKLYKQKIQETCEFLINNKKRSIKILDIQAIDNKLYA